MKMQRDQTTADPFLMGSNRDHHMKELRRLPIASRAQIQGAKPESKVMAQPLRLEGRPGGGGGSLFDGISSRQRAFSLAILSPQRGRRPIKL